MYIKNEYRLWPKEAKENFVKDYIEIGTVLTKEKYGLSYEGEVYTLVTKFCIDLKIERPNFKQKFRWDYESKKEYVKDYQKLSKLEMTRKYNIAKGSVTPYYNKFKKDILLDIRFILKLEVEPDLINLLENKEFCSSLKKLQQRYSIEVSTLIQKYKNKPK